MAISEYVSGQVNATDSLATLLWRYSYPKYTLDNFVLVMQGQLPIVIMMGYVLAVLNVTRNVVVEKEKRLKVNDFWLPCWVRKNMEIFLLIFLKTRWGCIRFCSNKFGSD